MTTHHQAVKHERGLAPFVPYSSHITSNTIMTRDGELLRIYRVQGIEFETAEPDDVNGPKEQFNTLLRSIGSPRVALWQHTVQRKVPAQFEASFRNDYADEFHKRYQASLSNSLMMATELYLTILYRPEPSKTVSLLNRVGRSQSDLLVQQKADLQSLDDIAGQIETGLSRYGLEPLTTYEDQHGALCSDALSFLNFLLAGSWQPVQVPQCSLSDYLGNAHIHVGIETIEIRTPKSTQFAQVVELKDYNGFTEAGLLNGLLYEPFEFVLAQSFSLYDRHQGENTLIRQRRYLETVEDGSANQVQQITEAIDQLIDGQFVLGEYHFVLTVLGDDVDQVRANTTSAMTSIEDRGFIACLANIATDAAFFSMLPGNWKFRPRIAHITSRNYAGLACLHNFNAGKAKGNPWGGAVTLFKTPSGRPIYFNFHTAHKANDQAGIMLPGNTRVIGKTGVGKTVLLNTLLIQAQQYDTGPGSFTTVFFDKDQGAKPCLDALGGEYLTIQNGTPTGFNPFQIAPTESNMLFLDGLITYLAKQNNQVVSTADEQRIVQAVRTVMALPTDMRRMSVLLQNITESTDTAERNNSITKRLAKWCSDDGTGKRGPLAWVFDNETDRLDFTGCPNYGIDGTEFLDNEQVRTPITLYLLHRIKQVIDGRRFIHFMDEAWKWLDDPAFEAFASDEQATIRKKNGLLVMATQSPATVLNSAISSQLVEQVATEIYLPNPRAKHDEYVNGFGLTDTEYDIVRQLAEDSHLFLIKQDTTSRLAWLDLSGFDADLRILSGSKSEQLTEVA